MEVQMKLFKAILIMGMVHSSKVMSSLSSLRVAGLRSYTLTRTLGQQVERQVLKHTLEQRLQQPPIKQIPKLTQQAPAPSIKTQVPVDVSTSKPTTSKDYLNKIYSAIHFNIKVTNKLLVRPLWKNTLKKIAYISKFKYIKKFTTEEMLKSLNRVNPKTVEAIDTKFQNLKPTLPQTYNTVIPPESIVGHSRILDLLFSFIKIGRDPRPTFILRMGLRDPNTTTASLYRIFNLPYEIIHQIDNYFEAAVKDTGTPPLTMKEVTQTLIDDMAPLTQIFGKPVTPDNLVPSLIKYLTHHYNEIYYQEAFKGLFVQLFPPKPFTLLKSIKKYFQQNYSDINYNQALQQFSLQLTTSERNELVNFLKGTSQKKQESILQSLEKEHLTLTWRQFFNTIKSPWDARHYSKKSAPITPNDIHELVKTLNLYDNYLIQELCNLAIHNQNPKRALHVALPHLSDKALIGNLIWLNNYDREKDKSQDKKLKNAYYQGGLQLTFITIHDVREMLLQELNKRKGIVSPALPQEEDPDDSEDDEPAY